MFNQNLDWIIGNITDDGRIRIYYVTIKGFYRMFFSQRGFGFRSKENSELNEVLKYLCLIFIEKWWTRISGLNNMGQDIRRDHKISQS